MSTEKSPTAAVIATGLVVGRAAGPVIDLIEPLSFWGGFDVDTGTVRDLRHPRAGTCLTGAVVVMPAGRGSSSASSVLAEAVRLGTAPAAIVMAEHDEIVALGAIVAEELYGAVMPIVVVDATSLSAVAGWANAVVEPDDEGRASTRRVVLRGSN